MLSPRSMAATVRTLAADPQSFFQSHPPKESLGGALAVVSVVAVASTAAVAAVGAVLANQIDATVTITTLEPWSQSTCASFAEMDGPLPDPCTIDEPRTKQVSVGAKLWEEVVGLLPFVFVGTYVGWLLVTIGLHALSAFTDGSGSFGETLAVTGWATAFDLVSVAAGTAGLAVAAQGVDFAGDPDVLASQLQRAVDTTSWPFGVLGTLVGVGWSAYVWTWGLHEAHDASVSSAAFASGVLAVVAVLANLL
jgi:hypothetical protein